MRDNTENTWCYELSNPMWKMKPGWTRLMQQTIAGNFYSRIVLY